MKASLLHGLLPALAIPADATGTVLEAEVEGLVTGISLPQRVINGQTVVTTVGTVFEGGSAPDIDIGSKLEPRATSIRPAAS